jgi:L-aspartate oxidase
MTGDTAHTAVQTDVLVVGSGVAGLSVALGLAGARSVLVVDAGPGSTAWAQGGIAAAVEPDDDPDRHAADTAAAGAGLCDPPALARLVEESPVRLAELIAVGAGFDRDAGGRLATALEGGHSRRRVVHAGGDATGAEVSRALAAAAVRASIPWRRGTPVTALTVAPGGQVTGAVLATPAGPQTVRARATVLATGGIGHAYPASTNPPGVTGAGLALALLAGATLADVEFVQFHPTALWAGASRGQLPLVSEAVRGEGAVLLDTRHRRFMAGRHPLADLAPRDVVARAVVEAMGDRSHVWLDARAVPGFATRFPTVTAACRAIGVDPALDLVPVAPAEHFLCGGVATDGWGATDVPGLYAVGEAAATGVHGANRLASNSLAEGLVYGRRLAARLLLDLPAPATGAQPRALAAPGAATALARAQLGAAGGVVRDAAGLTAGLAALDAVRCTEPAWLVARAVLAAAAARQESRGCHFRADHPAPADWWRRRVAVRLDAGGVPRASVTGGERRAA